MKKFPVILVAFFCACSFTHPAINNSKKVAEALIKAENSGDYTSMSKFYTDDFNKAQSLAQRTARFQQLHEVLGDFVSDSCIKAVDSTDLNDFPCVFLKYKVQHTKLVSYEYFEIIKEEGNLKAEVHNIMQQ